MSNPILTYEQLKLERSIRALTTAIHLMQPQFAATQTPLSANPDNNTALSNVYNRIAILLTQGSKKDPGAHVVAVAGNSSHSGISLSALDNMTELDEPPSMSHLSENVDRGPGGMKPSRVEEIEPSKESLDALADPSRNSSTSQVPLAKHASDLLRALIEFSNSRAKHSHSFFRFVWLRCHYKIKHQLAADEVMLGKPIYMLLREWNLQETDTVEEEWFGVNRKLHTAFDSRGISFRLNKLQTRQYLFSRETVTAWCELFATIFKKVKDHAAKCDTRMTSSIDDLNDAFFTLDMFLYDNKAFQTLLYIPSLVTAVDDAMSSAEQCRRGLPPENSFDTPLYDVFVPDDPTTNPVLRSCKAVLSWMRAGLSLSRSKLLRGPIPKFYVVYPNPPTNGTSMKSLKDLMMSVILPRLSVDANNKAQIQTLLNHKDFANKIDFDGKIHCEAALMALVHSFTCAEPQKTVAPFSEDETRNLDPLFLNADRVVGVGKNPCFCCYWLAQLLQMNGRAFLVPGTHGIVFPWTPPAFGIPVSVLEGLEAILIRKLTDITRDWIAKQPTSRQRLPAYASCCSGCEDGSLEAIDMEESD